MRCEPCRIAVQIIIAAIFLKRIQHTFIELPLLLSVGAFYTVDGGSGDVFGPVIQDAVNRVRNNRTLLPEPHGMVFRQGDAKPVNAVYTAIDESKFLLALSETYMYMNNINLEAFWDALDASPCVFAMMTTKGEGECFS